MSCPPARTARCAAGVFLTAATGVTGAAARAYAQPAACPAAAPATTWAPPLDRVVNPGTELNAHALRLRDVLEQLAAAARVRLSYSRELLPFDRPACLDATPRPLGAALRQLLGGTGVTAVAVGGDQVVLTPAAAATGPAVPVLERVVVTGSTSAAPARRLPFALSVIDGASLGAASATAPLAQTLGARVPGVWAWTQPPTTLLARYGSLRGASSFGASAPKLYLDGVELANPLVLTELLPERVARVEVIRGPQGAALYGADAISGVINIVTRHDGAEGGAGRSVTVRSGVGAAGGDYAARPALAQDHLVQLRAGAGPQTAGLSFAGSTLGAYVPGAAARRLSATGDLRRVTGSSVVTATARLADAASSAPANPLLAVPNDIGVPNQRLQQLTAGVTATRAAGDRWTHTVTAGVDGYRLSGVATDLAPIPSPFDTAQRAARGGAARATLRASSAATVDVAPGVRATFTALADYGLLRDATADGASLAPAPRDTSASVALPDNGAAPRDTSIFGRTSVAWLSTAGLVGQATVAFRDAVFVTAGLRGERNDGFTEASRFAALPTIGVCYVRPLGAGAGAGGATVKLRAAYGSGLRPARTAARTASFRGGMNAFGPNPLGADADLGPESQRGVEAGADFLAGGGPGAPTFTAGITRFDQRASGLLQQVPGRPRDGWRRRAPSTRPEPGGYYGTRDFDYRLENVGEIDNAGWELESALQAGPLALGATFTLVDSRVRRTARDYTGDLRAGDRMLQVPRHTAGASAAWRAGRWSATVQAARASNWINYDRLAIARSGLPDSALVGEQLRAFWRRYPGITHLGASVGRDVARGLSVIVTGTNLLDREQGEPDNAAVLPGRTVTAGVRATF